MDSSRMFAIHRTRARTDDRSRRQRGATTTETALLVATMAVLVTGAVQQLGSSADEQYANVETALAFEDAVAGECRNSTWSLIPKDIRPNKDANGDGMICHKADIKDGAPRNRYRDNDEPLGS